MFHLRLPRNCCVLTLTPAGLQQAHIWPCSAWVDCLPLAMAQPCCIFPRCLQVENEHVLKSMKACVSETLSTLGQHFGQLLELALTREVQVSVGWAAGGGVGGGAGPGWGKL